MNIARFARWYQSVEYLAFGPALEKARFAHLDRLQHAHRIIVFGEGDGRALARLLAAAPQAAIDVIEISAVMIALAKRRIGESARVCFREEDALLSQWSTVPYDGVMTFFFLDCFDAVQARKLVRAISTGMMPEALWLLTDFALPARGWRRVHAQAWLFIMYRFFAAVSGLRVRQLPDMQTMLEENGLRRLRLCESRFGLIRSEVWQKPR